MITTGVIGGSEAYNLLKENFFTIKSINKVKTPFGNVSVFHLLKNGVEFYLISRHGEKRYSIIPGRVNYRANIYALKELGVSRIFAWSGPGSILRELKIGEIVIPEDMIDETKNRTYTFFERGGIGFIRSNPLFCPQMKNVVKKVMGKSGKTFKENLVYVCTEGPRLETRAEINKFKICGGHLVGMTLSPEVFLARELELCYLPICYITNYAEGIVEKEYDPSSLFGGMLEREKIGILKESVKEIVRVILDSIKILSGEKRSCLCNKNMERYRKNGVIGKDWHTWF